MKQKTNYFSCQAWTGKIAIMTLVMALNFGCRAGFDFLEESSKEGSSSPQQAKNEEPEPNEDDAVSQGNPLRQLSFKVGNVGAPVEFIFVVDNSISMNQILSQVETGLLQALTNNSFPETARLGAISTMISDGVSFDTPHPTITTYPGIEQEPGFLHLINDARIQQYRSNVTQYAELWSIRGCERSLFAPNDQNADGIPCLRSILQSSATALGTEAGIHAVYQFLDRNFNAPLFREGAIVNFIFVSDTHDPGRPDQQLIDARPSFDDLKLIAGFNRNLLDVKFHAISPQVRCTSEDIFDRAYIQLARVSRGEIADSCTTTDYTDFIANMIVKGQFIEPIFNLQPPAATITEVTVNGSAVFDYKLENGGRQLILEGLDPKGTYEVTVSYLSQDSVPNDLANQIDAD